MRCPPAISVWARSIAPAAAGQPVQGRARRCRWPPPRAPRARGGRRRRRSRRRPTGRRPRSSQTRSLTKWPPSARPRKAMMRNSRAPDLDEQVAGDEQPRAPVEGVGDRDRHEQAGEHQPDQQQPHRQPVRVEPVRPPRDHVPRVEDRERHDHRLGAGPQVDVLEQVVRELPDREDVDEVEEQLERGDDALRAGRPRDGNPHRGDPTRVARDGRFPCQRRPPVPPAPRLRRDCFLGLPRSVTDVLSRTMNLMVRPCADRLGEFCGRAPRGGGLRARPRLVRLQPILGDSGPEQEPSTSTGSARPCVGCGLDVHVDADEPVPVRSGRLLRQGGIPGRGGGGGGPDP